MYACFVLKWPPAANAAAAAAAAAVSDMNLAHKCCICFPGVKMLLVTVVSSRAPSVVKQSIT
jgi:hypothetical protein